MTPVYKGQLSSSLRGIRLLTDKSVLIQDEFTSINDCEVQWSMLTKAEVQKVNDKKLLLKIDNKKMILEILGQSRAKVEVSDTAKYLKSHDQPNPGISKIAFTLKSKKGNPEKMIVWLRPDSPLGEPKIKSLKDW